MDLNLPKGSTLFGDGGFLDAVRCLVSEDSSLRFASAALMEMSGEWETGKVWQ